MAGCAATGCQASCNPSVEIAFRLGGEALKILHPGEKLRGVITGTVKRARLESW
jgi:hypothetical protein